MLCGAKATFFVKSLLRSMLLFETEGEVSASNRRVWLRRGEFGLDVDGVSPLVATQQQKATTIAAFG
jgi:hypothetical protein